MDEQLKQAFMQYLAQKSGAQTQEELEAYIQQLGEDGLKQEYAQFMQLMQEQQVQMRKFGGMLNYIDKLRGNCPPGTEARYYKVGGAICKKCMKKASEGAKVSRFKNSIDEFKQMREEKKARKNVPMGGGYHVPVRDKEKEDFMKGLGPNRSPFNKKNNSKNTLSNPNKKTF